MDQQLGSASLIFPHFLSADRGTAYTLNLPSLLFELLFFMSSKALYLHNSTVFLAAKTFTPLCRTIYVLGLCLGYTYWDQGWER
jgi:hypothetical protein